LELRELVATRAVTPSLWPNRQDRRSRFLRRVDCAGSNRNSTLDEDLSRVVLHTFEAETDLVA